MGCIEEKRRPKSLTAKSYAQSYEPLKQYVLLEFGILQETNITVYRKEAKDFIFDYHGKEFFDGMMPEEEDVVFNGNIAPVYSYAEYRDYDVEIGKVYAYWVSSDNGESKTGPVAVTTRDARVWWHYDKIMSEMQDMSEKYPDTELVQVGETVEHRPLVAIIAGNRENMIACMGNVHAGESGAEITLSSLRYILENKPELLEKTGLAVLPSVNADRREEMATGAPWYIRVNKNGVDINRNFNVDWEEVTYDYDLSSADPRAVTYKGRYAESEPETKAIIEFIRLTKPKIALSFHSLCSIATDKMLVANEALSDETDKNKIEAMVRAYSDAFREAFNMPVRKERISIPSSYPGVFVRWAYTQGVYGVDLELNLGDELDYFAVSRRDKTDLEMLEKCIELHRKAIMALMELQEVN